MAEHKIMPMNRICVPWQRLMAVNPVCYNRSAAHDITWFSEKQLMVANVKPDVNT